LLASALSVLARHPSLDSINPSFNRIPLRQKAERCFPGHGRHL
jgi:hypothetical protein